MITLAIGANAEPDTCGSCKFFERRRNDFYDGMYGECRIKLPAHFVEQRQLRGIDPKQRDQEYTGNEDRIKDTDRCDLYRSDGNQYIIQRRAGVA